MYFYLKKYLKQSNTNSVTFKIHSLLFNFIISSRIVLGCIFVHFFVVIVHVEELHLQWNTEFLTARRVSVCGCRLPSFTGPNSITYMLHLVSEFGTCQCSRVFCGVEEGMIDNRFCNYKKYIQCC